MSDPVAFLRDKLNEVERVAREAGLPWGRENAGRWTNECQHNWGWGVPGEDSNPPEDHLPCPVVTGDIHIYDEGGHDGHQAAHIAMHDPASVLRRVAADRKILEIHSIEEEPIFEFTGDYEERTDSDGRPTRYFPPGSITGQRQVGTRYLCANCERHGDNEPWPCATVRALAEGYGWTGGTS